MLFRRRIDIRKLSFARDTITAYKYTPDVGVSKDNKVIISSIYADSDKCESAKFSPSRGEFEISCRTYGTYTIKLN